MVKKLFYLIVGFVVILLSSVEALKNKRLPIGSKLSQPQR